ncbi:cysteine desulfurase family protein [Commensalibacter communis]|uniref:cysteine desulfurase family protein n=1 Tax=Commensalibacter communis TaxID=2972786 RepID=UPI0022FF5941|nr:cysteine desulfurase family protein [Commensalibacter communis]CAI3950460.1 Cysteine desulfurase/Cysteine sulfinate desulfinase IscS or related enzyme [Commensalibacter communis]CAI3956031.1 Cysteine desulfurase/Cysteine sulfinate desulfinase IscS or related enzyme [Commensalibacter communis]
MNKPVYLDANASEPVRDSVISEMVKALHITGNPSSVHAMGRRCYHMIEDAREVVADHFGGDVQNCIFTSGGTEADILAIHGQKQDRPLWVGATEHPAISQIDYPKTILPVTQQGIVDLGFLEQSLQQAETPPLICLMLANSETGVLHPIQEAAELCHHYGALLHVDAVQAAGRIKIDLSELGADSLAISAHKMGGPKGIGALLLASGNIRGAKRLDPLFIGGGQEQGRRGGTQALPMIVGMAEAVRASYIQDRTAIIKMRDAIEAAAKKHGAVVCGEGAKRLDNTSCLAFEGKPAQQQLMALDMAGFCVSTGSACSSGKVAKSPVLIAMGLQHLAGYSIRVSLPWNNNKQETEQFIEAYCRMVAS